MKHFKSNSKHHTLIYGLIRSFGFFSCLKENYYVSALYTHTHILFYPQMQALNQMQM